MNRILILIIFIISFASNSIAEVIKKLNVKGNNRVSKETIILFGDIKLNQEIDSIQLNNIIKNLYETNFFKNVKIKILDDSIEIVVVENPLVQSVSIEGVKNKNILKILRENMTLKEKSSFIPTLANVDKKKLLNILRSNGYYRAKIKQNYVESPNNTVDLIYDVSLGKKASIKQIKFIGDKKIKNRKLRSVIVSEEDKFWKFISKNRFIDEKKILLDKKLLKNYYKNNGYYNVNVESSSVQLLNEDDFLLTYKITAGEKYYFNNLTLDLPPEYNKENFNSLNKVFKKLKGKKYSFKKIQDILEEIDKIALSKEYEFIDATYNENIVNKNQINLSINLFESEKFYVEKINIYGNYISEEKVIRNSLIVDEGDPLNEILLNKSINEVKSKGIFKTVNKTVKEGSEKNTKIIDIIVEEKPTGEIFAGVGTGTTGTTFTAGIKENNYLGKGVKLNTSFSVGENKSTGIFSVINPNYKNSDKESNFRIEVSEDDQLSNYGYKSNKEGFSIGLEYEQYKDVFFSPSLSLYHDNLETDSSASASRKKQEGDYVDAEFSYGLSLNKLDSNFQPKEGFLSAFNQTLPILTDDGIITNSYRMAKFIPIQDDMIFSVRFLATAVNSITDDDVRLTKRAYIPQSRLRGFEAGKVGPTDSGDFIGGNYASALNFNTTLPKLLTDLQNVDFNLFLDAANVWGVDYDSSLDNSKIRSSTGLAVDWLTPIGPLSFSFALPITKADTDSTESFRFDIGTSF